MADKFTLSVWKLEPRTYTQFYQSLHPFWREILWLDARGLTDFEPLLGPEWNG